MEESRLTRFFKIAIAVVILFLLGMAGGLILSVGADSVEENESTATTQVYTAENTY